MNRHNIGHPNTHTFNLDDYLETTRDRFRRTSVSNNPVQTEQMIKYTCPWIWKNILTTIKLTKEIIKDFSCWQREIMRNLVSLYEISIISLVYGLSNSLKMSRPHGKFMYYFFRTNSYNVLRFFLNIGDIIQCHGGLRSRELGQAPILLVSLTPRQALSSHPRVFTMILWEFMNFYPD